MCGEIKNTVAAIIDPDLPIKWMTRVYRRVCAPFMVWIDNNVRGGVFGVRGKGGGCRSISVPRNQNYMALPQQRSSQFTYLHSESGSREIFLSPGIDPEGVPADDPVECF